MSKVTIEFEEEHVSLISKALEAYSRARLGQFGIMVDEIFKDKMIDWEDRDTIEKVMRGIIFREEEGMKSLSCSFGVGNEKIGDGQIAYEVSKVLTQYLSVKQSGGLWGYTTNFSDPLEYSGVALPEVKGFQKYVEHFIEDPDGIFHKAFQAKDAKYCWYYIDENVPHRKGEKSEIVEDFYEGDTEMQVDYYLRIHKPRLDIEEF